MVWQHFSLFLKTFILITLSWTGSLSSGSPWPYFWFPVDWSGFGLCSMFTQYWRQCPKNFFPPFLNILPSWPRATAAGSRAIKSHLTASLNRGCSLKLLSHGLQIYSSTCSPVNKLLDHLHPTVELIKSQDVLLSEETQTRALPKILSATPKSRVRKI